MDFEEKIYTILKTNKLQIVTKEELSEFCGFHRDTIRKAIERNSELGERYTRIFLDKLSINPEWWDTGKGGIYLQNHTHKHKPDDNTQNPKPMEDPDPADVYQKIVEGNTEYILIPRSVLNEKYRLVSMEQLAKEQTELEIKKEELKMKDTQIHGLYSIIKHMTEALSGIKAASEQPVKLPEVEKTEQNLGVTN